MKITIIYDNEAWAENLQADWGFSCLIEAHHRKLLFDTGTKAELLLENMRKLDIDPTDIEEIVISHDHHDHTGGLEALLKIKQVPVYFPASAANKYGAEQVVPVDKAMSLHEGIFTTGELENIEQSLVVMSDKGPVVVVGCAHSGVGNILAAAAQLGTPYALIGGLHGFDQYEQLEGLKLICPTHCTQHIKEIEERYGERCIKGGAGRVIEI